ncbi:MAG: hypothetical protein VYE68_15285 [Acidobacteriota bacterium]|nr:hypothetical protein [Acidobacteriota bacterium]
MIQARQSIGVAGEGLGQRLERDVTVQRGIAGAIHPSHPAFAKQSEPSKTPSHSQV